MSKRKPKPEYDPALDKMPEKEWHPGDPCATCGSENTGWDIVDGAFCSDCGATDADE